MLISQSIVNGRPILHACDRRCEKAWGVNGRRLHPGAAIEFEEVDDIVHLADYETGIAPADFRKRRIFFGAPLQPAVNYPVQKDRA